MPIPPDPVPQTTTASTAVIAHLWVNHKTGEGKLMTPTAVPPGYEGIEDAETFGWEDKGEVMLLRPGNPGGGSRPVPLSGSEDHIFGTDPHRHDGEETEASSRRHGDTGGRLEDV